MPTPFYLYKALGIRITEVWTLVPGPKTQCACYIRQSLFTRAEQLWQQGLETSLLPFFVEGPNDYVHCSLYDTTTLALSCAPLTQFQKKGWRGMH